ncbi:hypothetical protein GTA08_BOTSDO13594 [Neofusicoccum parvum]|uniref:Uncharacterized protein n=1 Tax=Neofusicoccum parvum TaxID=310453 RepID=A0ACB5RQ81_9PEZI|nr:hypothetical protein GTA08_BOTSDO13594 [Neofusicoccum parvum]
MPPQDGPDELSANSNADSSSFHDETDDTDSISKLDLNAQPNGVSPRGPSGTVSHLTRSSGLVFINYTPTDDSQQHHRVIPTTNPPTPDLEPADNHTLRHRRSHSSQSSARHSPYQPPSSRDLSGSTLAGSINSTPSPLPASLSRTGNGSPFPALTPQSGLALPPPLSTPRCPTCGRRSDSYYYYHGPLPTATSSIAPNSSRLTPHRPAPPPPTATTPSPALTRHRSNALTTTPFRLQSPPRGRHQRHNPSTVLRGGAASAGPRPPPPLLRTHTSPLTATLATATAAPLYAARRRSQSDSLRRARSPPARLRRRQQETTPPCTPPRTPRLRPRAGTGGAGAGAGAGMEEFEGLVERLRRAYAGEDEGGRGRIRGFLEGFVGVGKRGCGVVE